jgi:hypothetical protein
MQQVRERLTANVLLCGLAILLISSCSTLNPIEVTSTPIEKPQLVLPSADLVNMRELRWIVINEDNVELVFEILRKTGRPVALFSLDGKSYENVSLNLSDLRTFIQQQTAIIAAYQDYYNKANAAIDEANTPK